MEYKNAMLYFSGCFILCGIIFIALKLCNIINWSWMWILAPIWIISISWIVSLLIVGIVAIISFTWNKGE